MRGLGAWIITYVLLWTIVSLIFPGWEPTFFEALGVVAIWGTANGVQKVVESL